MKFKHLLIAAVAAVSTVLPAQARVERSTERLLQVISPNVLIAINDTKCDTHNIHGAYVTIGTGAGHGRKMVLCPGDGKAKAIDHSTVRHEMVHVLQHCVNVQRGTPRNTPIIQDIDKLAGLVNTYVPEDQVTFIKSSYPQHKWLVEFEANYGERAFSSTQLIELWDEFDCADVLK